MFPKKAHRQFQAAPNERFFTRRHPYQMGKLTKRTVAAVTTTFRWWIEPDNYFRS
ncbi:hypothetical protein TTRE_0000009401 [Trichuris trichiura]|uniref:Uncharacterized protein n=1 Tax=Trichuris trichiura TaxID=36087 RepID=A0A077YZM9_TRITR|nr:hypothetical protein TTRE_0000009401 [Trichuris trichiura]